MRSHPSAVALASTPSVTGSRNGNRM
jgi:hypothetical protein